MIAWLRTHYDEVGLLSLDHDLPIRRTDDGQLEDLGTGQLVAEFLSTMSPTCPVIVHSSNADGARRIVQSLRSGGWRVVRVYPFDDTRWIHDVWSNEIRRLIEPDGLPS
jgi:hypothetical protein